jgi:hypothetical protein
MWPTALVLCPAGVFILAGDGLPRSLAVLLALAAAQVAAVHVLADALQPGSLAAASPAPSYAVAASAAIVGLAAIVPPLVYQLDYDVPLGFPNWLVLVAAAGVLAAAGLRRSIAPSEPPAPRRSVVTLLAVSALPVLVGTAIAGFAWAATAEAVAERQRSPEHSGVVMSWNVHFAVNAEGGVDPEALADSIAAQNADVVSCRRFPVAGHWPGALTWPRGCRTACACTSPSLLRRTDSSATPSCPQLNFGM